MNINVLDNLLWGGLNRAMVCPYCQTKGVVRTMPVQRKRGISGVKAFFALLTGGWSLLFKGFSKKVKVFQAHCDNCGATWEDSNAVTLPSP